MQVLVIDNKGKECKRGHSKFFNHKIQGSNKRFCTFMLITEQQDGKGGQMCGDVA